MAKSTSRANSSRSKASTPKTEPAQVEQAPAGTPIVEPPAPAAPTINELTAEGLAALAKEWDDARTDLQAAGDAVATAQSALDATENGTAEEIQAALEAMDAAEKQAKVAEERIATLKARHGELPKNTEGSTAPDTAVEPATAGGSAPEAAAPGDEEPQGENSQDTSESEDQGEGGNSATLAGGPMAQLGDFFQGAIDDVIADARRMRDDGDVDAARRFLAERRRESLQVAELCVHADKVLAAEQLSIGRTKKCWALDAIRLDREYAAGEPLILEPEQFDRLEAKGKVSATEPV